MTDTGHQHGPGRQHVPPALKPCKDAAAQPEFSNLNLKIRKGWRMVPDWKSFNRDLTAKCSLCSWTGSCTERKKSGTGTVVAGWQLATQWQTSPGSFSRFRKELLKSWFGKGSHVLFPTAASSSLTVSRCSEEDSHPGPGEGSPRPQPLICTEYGWLQYS